MPQEDKAASEVLTGVVQQSTSDDISFAEIKLALHERGFGLLMLVFALITLPLPPGLTVLAAIPLLFFSVQMILGVDSPWLPSWIGRRRIKRRTLALMVEKASPHLRKVERLLRPRFSYASSRTGEKIVGVFCLLFSMSIAIPLPFTNFIPAIGIALMSLGLLSKDGVVITIGMIVGMGGVMFTFVVWLKGPKFVAGLMGL